MYYLFSIFIFQVFGSVHKLRSRTRRLFPTLCSGTAPTTEHVYVPNHARGLVDLSLRCARILCRPLSTFTFPTTLGDLSTSLYAVLGDYADHRARLRSQLYSGTGRSVSMSCSGTVLTTDHARTHQSLPALCSGLASITLRPQLTDCFSQLHMNWTG